MFILQPYNSGERMHLLGKNTTLCDLLQVGYTHTTPAKITFPTTLWNPAFPVNTIMSMSPVAQHVNNQRQPEALACEYNSSSIY